MIYTTVETKGFKAGEGLRKFLSDQLLSLTETYKNLNSAALKISFADNHFHCDLTLEMADQLFSISLCERNFYEVVLNTIDFAESTLINRLVNVSGGSKKKSPGRSAFPKRMIFQFSAN